MGELVANGVVGIWTADGELHQFDVIVCATGFNVSHRPSWPLIGRHGISLAEQWKEEPESYLSMIAAGFPNSCKCISFLMMGRLGRELGVWLISIDLVIFSSPNAPVGHGSWMAGLGWSADWMCQWLTKMAEEDIKYVYCVLFADLSADRYHRFVDVKLEVVDDFNTYAVEIMETLVWTGGCRSWCKNHRVNDKVTAVWAGSVLLYKEMIDHIRPEDFKIRYRSPNRF